MVVIAIAVNAVFICNNVKANAFVGSATTKSRSTTHKIHICTVLNRIWGVRHYLHLNYEIYSKFT